MPANAAAPDDAAEKARAANRERQAKHRKKKAAQKKADAHEAVVGEAVNPKSAQAQRKAGAKVFAGIWNILEGALCAFVGDEMRTTQDEHDDIVDAGGELLESMSDNLKDSPGVMLALCIGSYGAARVPVIVRKFRSGEAANEPMTPDDGAPTEEA